MRRRPPRSTRTDTLFPYTTLFRSLLLIYVLYYQLGLAPAPLGRLDIFFSTPTRVTGFYLVDTLLDGDAEARSEEHTSELQSLMRNSYAVFCLKKNTTHHRRCNVTQSTKRPPQTATHTSAYKT